MPVPRARRAVNRALLDQRLGQLAGAGLRPEVIGLLQERILKGSDDQLTRIRPFALADLWAADRLEVLRLFLHATSAGLFQLQWELMCPNCRVPKAETSSLVQLPVQFHCDTCGISYDADLDQRVELRFSVHPAIRRADEQVYCIGGPLRMPHAVAQQYIRPHEDRRVDLDLTGSVQLRTVRAAHRLLLTPVAAQSRARDITITYSGGRWVDPHSLTRDDSLTVPSGSHAAQPDQRANPGCHRRPGLDRRGHQRRPGHDLAGLPRPVQLRSAGSAPATGGQPHRLLVQRPQGLHAAVRRDRRRGRLQPGQPAFRLHQAGGRARRRQCHQDDGRRG